MEHELFEEKVRAQRLQCEDDGEAFRLDGRICLLGLIEGSRLELDRSSNSIRMRLEQRASDAVFTGVGIHTVREPRYRQ